MRPLALLIAFCSLPSLIAVAADDPPITPAEAAKKVNEKVLVEMEVKSTGGKNNHYLNSEKDFNSDKNFTIFISKDHLEKFKKAGVENPSTYYKDKLIRVSGKVVLENQKPWIKVDDPDQIKIVTKEKTSAGRLPETAAP